MRCLSSSAAPAQQQPCNLPDAELFGEVADNVDGLVKVQCNNTLLNHFGSNQISEQGKTLVLLFVMMARFQQMSGQLVEKLKKEI